MVMLLWSPLRRIWRAALGAPGLAGSGTAVVPRSAAQVAPVVFRSPAMRPVRHQPSVLRQPAQPLTPFRVVSAGSVACAGPARGQRRKARPFWMTLDPRDRRRAAIGGSFAEVCAALERLAAAEEGLRH
jgi:hypothetical protein